jgi:hypothetical protein
MNLLDNGAVVYDLLLRYNKELNEFDVHESVHRNTVTKVTNKVQIYRLIYYSKSALHVLGDVFAHQQEDLTVFTVSSSIHISCCRLVSWMSFKTPAGNNLGEYYQML